MIEMGIWSVGDGGFVETGLYDEQEAGTRLGWYKAGANGGEYMVKLVCSRHEEQIAGKCPVCDAN